MLPAFMDFLKVEHPNAQCSELICLKLFGFFFVLFFEFSSCSEYNIKLR